MRKLLMLTFLILPLTTIGLVGCGDETDDPQGDIGAGGTGDPGTGGTGGDGGNDGKGGDGGTGGDGGSDCVNTSLTCDECVTPNENTYEACSPHTENCVPFNNEARVPGYPDVPVVP